MSRPGLEYFATNENVNAIMAGLEPSTSDTILTVTSGGDQALAMLENAGRVIVCDKNPHQIAYVRERVEALSRGDYETFLSIAPYHSRGCSTFRLSDAILEDRTRLRRRYFCEEGRLEQIRSKLDRLEFASGDDIFALGATIESVTKIYASNAKVSGWTLRHRKQSRRLVLEALASIASNLPISGRIYTCWSMLGKYGLPDELVLDEEKTRAAKDLEPGSWAPRVLRKVA